MEDLAGALLDLEWKLENLATDDSWPDTAFIITELQRVRKALEKASAPVKTDWFALQPRLEEVANEHILESLHGFTAGEILGTKYEDRFEDDEIEDLMRSIITDYIVYLVYHE